jgi:hypothetical protein
MNSKLSELLLSLSYLEDKIFYHAKLKQVDTVESFLHVIVTKAKLNSEITLLASWTDEYINNNQLFITISTCAGINNIPLVDELYNLAITKKFKYCKFLKYIQNTPISDDLALSMISKSNKPVKLKYDDMKFSVIKGPTAADGRSIKLAVYINDIKDDLLTQASSEDHWLPDSNLMYVLDLILGEYYMIKHILSINFFPLMLLLPNARVLSINECIEEIETLLNKDFKKCSKCKNPEYRVKIENDICINCIK